MPPIGIPQRVSGAFQYRAPARPAAPARKPAPVSLSLSQAANRQVDQQLAPQEAAQTAFNDRQSSVIQSFANALLGKLQPIAGQVGQQYDQAIQQTGALSNQSAQFLQNANPTPQVQALLQSAGAPQAQQDQIGQQLGQTFGGGAGVLSFLGGAVPGGQMASDKATAQSQAAQLPGFAALKGQQDLSSALWQQGQDRQKLEATRPALYQAAAQNIRTNNYRRDTAKATADYRTQTIAEHKREFDTTTAAKKSAADFLQWYRTKGIHLDEKKVNDAWTKYQTGAAETRRHHLATENKPPAQKIVGSDKTGRYLFDPKTGKKTLIVPPVSGSKKTGGISSTSYANLRKQALKQADLFYYGKQPSSTGTGGVPGIDYGPALKQLMDGYSLNRQDAMAILNDFYAPGERGRSATGKQAKTPAEGGVGPLRP